MSTPAPYPPIGSEWTNGTSRVRVDDNDGAYAYCTELEGPNVGTRYEQRRIQPLHFGAMYREVDPG